MTFNVLGLAFSLCFINMIFATPNNEHKSEYNCSIDTVDQGVRDKMKLLLEDGKKITFIHLVFTNQTNPFSNEYRGDIYRPMEWVRIAGRHGRSLLFLRPEFEELSLTTLSLETGYIDVSLVQKPNNCLLRFNTTIVENKLKDLLLSDFKPGKDGGSLSAHEYICNVHIENDNYNAKFFYRCCHKDKDGYIVCENLIYDFWIYVVFYCGLIINIVAIMFSPYMIPDSFYRKKYGKIKYEMKLMKPLQIVVKKVSSTEYSFTVEKGSIRHSLSSKILESMTSLRKSIEGLPVKKEKTLVLDKVDIDVQYRRLIPANYVPFGVVKTLYAMFVKCHVRKPSKFDNCCSASIFGNLTNKTCKATNKSKKVDDNKIENGNVECVKETTKYSWIKCLKLFMRMFIILGISLPWIIRICFYYLYEKSHTLQKTKAAIDRNMTLSLQWNLTNTLTPIHMLFVLCYIVIVIDALVFGVVSQKIKEKLQSLMRKCLRDMRDLSRSKALEWSALVIVVPFELFGIFGFFLIGIYLVLVLPVIIGVLAFYCLPTMNLVLRLVVHVFAYLMPYAQKSSISNAAPEDNVDQGTCTVTEKLPLQSSYESDANSHESDANSHESDANSHESDANSHESDANSYNMLSACHKMLHLNILLHKESLERPQADIKKCTLKNRFVQLFVLIACLTTVISLILLTLEMVLFLIEIFIYTIIGIIMNASAMLKYISLIFMLGLYARDCFKGISDKYLEFNKLINQLIVEKLKNKIAPVASMECRDQKNTAFQNEKDPDDSNDAKEIKNIELVVEDGTPRWKIPQMILFLDNYDIPYLPERFFELTCYMKTAGVPGPLIYNVVQATWRFLCICVFLMFVVLIVLAFGDEYQISGTNQMLATLAGGFLPWIFRNILFKSKDALTLDTKNLSFRFNLEDVIQGYDENWDIADIVEKKDYDRQTETFV